MAKTWTRTASVQRFGWTDRAGWTPPPEGATAVHSTRRVQRVERHGGHKAPVYGRYYTYRIRDWRDVRKVKVSSDTGQPVLPQAADGERLVVVSDVRTATFHGPNVPAKPRELGERVWRSLHVGERVGVRFPGFIIMPADSLADCQAWRDRREKPPEDSGCNPAP
jgi:hypothetical protein